MRGYNMHFSFFMTPMEVISDDTVSNSILFTINFLRIFFIYTFFLFGLQLVLQITNTNVHTVYMFFSKAFKKLLEVVYFTNINPLRRRE